MNRYDHALGRKDDPDEPDTPLLKAALPRKPLRGFSRFVTVIDDEGFREPQILPSSSQRTAFAVAAAGRLEDKALRCIELARLMLPNGPDNEIEAMAVDLRLLPEGPLGRILDRMILIRSRPPAAPERPRREHVHDPLLDAIFDEPERDEPKRLSAEIDLSDILENI